MRVSYEQEATEMENDFLPSASASRELTERELQNCNERTARFGLMLTGAEISMLAAAREDALRDTGRVEFGSGILGKLAERFCDSPFLTRENWADTLAELQDDFYYFKNESSDRLSDDELIEIMKKVFDGPAQGSLDYLSGTSLPELCRRAREDWDPANGDAARELF